MRNVESVYYVDNKLDVGVFVMLTKEASARRSDDFFVSMTSE